jgi:hypothetical protein
VEALQAFLRKPPDDMPAFSTAALSDQEAADMWAFQLRTLQTMAEISIEKNSTIIFPAQFMTTVQEALAQMGKGSASK